MLGILGGLDSGPGRHKVVFPPMHNSLIYPADCVHVMTDSRLHEIGGEGPIESAAHPQFSVNGRLLGISCISSYSQTPIKPSAGPPFQAEPLTPHFQRCLDFQFQILLDVLQQG
jgi:hypothetical protein